MSEAHPPRSVEQSEHPLANVEETVKPEKLVKLIQHALAEFTTALDTADTSDEVTTKAEALWKLIDRADAVLDSFDAEEFHRTVDVDKLPEAVDLSEIPEAIGTSDPKRAIDVDALRKAIDFREYWSSPEMQALWKESKGFKDTLEAVVGQKGGQDDEDRESNQSLSGVSEDELKLVTESTEGRIHAEISSQAEIAREKVNEARNRLVQQIEESELGPNEVSQPQRMPRIYCSIPTTRADMRVTTELSTMPRNRPDMDV